MPGTKVKWRLLVVAAALLCVGIVTLRHLGFLNLGLEKTALSKPTAIDGLFGLKLGAPLPPDCRILSMSTNHGQIQIAVIPPQPNVLFDSYAVFVMPSGHVITSIEAVDFRPNDQNPQEFAARVQAFLDALSKRYGPRTSENKELQTYMWTNGDRSILVVGVLTSINISCADSRLQNQAVEQWTRKISAVDTNGLY